jgi:Mn-dependent DtxR family transcriptional regulator
VSIQRLRSTVNTREESMYATVSRLEDKGLVYADSARSIELTEDGAAALELLDSNRGVGQ